jgi:lipopolysaccharide export system permease protein
MNLLTRYVLREVLQIFLLTLTALTFFMLLVAAGKEAVSNGVGPKQVLEMLPYFVPNALLFSIPGTILLAVSMVYGRMSNFGEIVAIKSLGISPMAVITPALIIATVLSFVTVWLNDVAVSWGTEGIATVLVNSIEDIMYGMLRTNKAFSTKTFSIVVREVRGRILIDPVITYDPGGDGPKITITAREAELRSVPGSGMLTMIFRDGQVEADGNSFVFDDYEQEVPLPDVAGKGIGVVSPSNMSMRHIPSQIIKQQEAMERAEQLLAAKGAYRMMTGDFAELGGAAWSSQASSLNTFKSTLNKLKTEPPRRWATGFSCLCFALVGVPLAIRLRNSDVLTSFFLCFLPILLIYYPLMLVGLDRSKAGAIPPMTVWVANLILILWGVWLLRRVIRY